jgi:hypothetical protein
VSTTNKHNLDVQILKVLAPDNTGADGGGLDYGPDNINANALNRSLEPVTWEAFMNSDPGSLDEARSAKKLAEIFLGASAVQLMTGIKDSETQSRQADWFTAQSIEIYGTQDVEDTKELLRRDLLSFTSFMGLNSVDQEDVKRIINLYRALGIEEFKTASDKPDNQPEIESSLENGDKLFEEYLHAEFGFMLDHFDGTTLYSAQDLLTKAEQILLQLTQKDARWDGWKVTAKKDGSMSVSTKEKEIKIGVKRAPSLGSEAGPALVHEFVGHMLRSVNGEQTGDVDLQYGLAGYTDFEEGLGCYMEYVLTGKTPAKISNRQITASLALGQLGDGKKFDRNEIYEILKLRTKVLLQADGEASDELLAAKYKELRTLVIDRFFRGGRGVGPVMSVYTKDIIYAQGFEKVKKYVSEKIKAGANPQQLFDFLLSAKFDATNPEHLKRLKAANISIIE